MRYFLTIQMSFFSSYFCPQLLVSISDSCLQQLLPYCLMVIFLISLFLLISWNFTIKKGCSFSFNYFFNYLLASVCTPLYLFYSMCYNSLLLLFLLLLSFPRFGLGGMSLTPILFVHAPTYFLTLTYFLAPQRSIPGPICNLCPSLGINSFSKEPWFCLLETGI